jgi:hypothetical protein
MTPTPPTGLPILPLPDRQAFFGIVCIYHWAGSQPQAKVRNSIGTCRSMQSRAKQIHSARPPSRFGPSGSSQSQSKPLPLRSMSKFVLSMCCYFSRATHSRRLAQLLLPGWHEQPHRVPGMSSSHCDRPLQVLRPRLVGARAGALVCASAFSGPQKGRRLDQPAVS